MMSTEKDNVPIAINIKSISNLRGQRGEQITVFLRCEFGDKTLGDSESMDLDPAHPNKINKFSPTLQCNRNDFNFLDEIAHKPILITVIEVPPKDKKGKEQTSTPLAQCCVDLLPLLRGRLTLQLLLTLHPIPGSSLDAVDAARGELEVGVSVPQPLLPGERLKECNLVTIGLGALYSPPDSWRVNGPPFVHTASLSMPINEDKEKTIVFANGVLKTAAAANVERETLKKWSNCPNAQGEAEYIQDSYVPTTSYHDDRGDFLRPDQKEFRAKAEGNKSRVVWGTERRCHLEPGAVKVLEKKITKSRFWPVEVFKTPVPSQSKAKKNEDEQAVSFHGVAYVNLSPLLYPGATYLRGAYRVYPYNEQEVFDRTKRKETVVDSAARAASDFTVRNLNSPYIHRKTDKESDPRKLVRKKPEKRPEDDAEERFTVTSKTGAGGESGLAEGRASGPHGPGLPPLTAEAPDNDNRPDAQQYIDAKSYIFLEVSLANPIIPKRKREELAKRVAEYVPPRPLFPKRVGGADQAVEDYHRQVASVANKLLDEFRDLFGDGDDDDGVGSGGGGGDGGGGGRDAISTHEEMEERKKKLMYELTVSGKHFAFKEQLKHSVVKIVREKFLQTKTFDSAESLQQFLGDLYVFLVDQMHKGLSKVIQVEDQPALPRPVTDSAQLKRFASEAEINLDFELAARFHADRISLDRKNPEHWIDFGTFCLLTNDMGKAEECFRESVALDASCVPGLLLYALLCANSQRHEEAEDLFEAATAVDPGDVVAHVMFGLFYNSIGNDILSGMAFEAAVKTNFAAAQPKVAESLEDSRVEAERAEMIRVIDSKKDGRISKGGNRIPTKKPSESRLQVDSSKSQRKSTAVPTTNEQKASKTPAERPSPPVTPEMSAFLKTAFWCLDMNAISFAEMALAQELMHANDGPDGAYHLAMARLHLQREHFKEAEESIQESLQFSYQDPDCWSLLGHVLFLQADFGGARECYERTLDLVRDAGDAHAVYLRLASIYLQEEQYQSAKKTYLSACKESPSSVSWLGVGISCYRLGELEEAEDALVEANILNNLDAAVWGYLALVCLQTGRVLEAEQSYKYCMKLQLDDQLLIKEIQNLQKVKGFGNPAY